MMEVLRLATVAQDENFGPEDLARFSLYQRLFASSIRANALVKAD